jgi:2-hydroxycyclohexanecarboxyl-CoA dehydrogenase
MIADQRPLAGKVAFVAGGSGGIGGPLAAALGEAGADVAVTYNSRPQRARDVIAKIEASGSRGIAYELDVRDPAAIHATFAQAASALGPIDILLTAIGAGAHEFFLKQDPAEWQRVWETDIRSIFFLCRAALPAMVERKAGRVIFLSSDSAKAGNSGGAVSSAARGALHSFIKSMTREHGRDNITFNAVCPGPTRTDTLDNLLKDDREGHMKYWERVVRNIPLKRPGETSEIAGLVVYLASPLGGFVSGQAISVSGGLTMV